MTPRPLPAAALVTVVLLAGCRNIVTPAPAPVAASDLRTPSSAVARFDAAYAAGDAITLRRLIRVTSADDLLTVERTIAEAELRAVAGNRFGPATVASLEDADLLTKPVPQPVETDDGYLIDLAAEPFSPAAWQRVQTIRRLARDADAGVYENGRQLTDSAGRLTASPAT